MTVVITKPAPADLSPPGTIFRDWRVTSLWCGQLFSLLGDQLYMVGLLWYASANYGRAATGVGLSLAMALPGATLGVLAGTVVDRSERTRVLLGSNLARAVLVLGMGLCFLIARPPAPLVYGLVAVVAAAGVPFNPALQSFLPRVAGTLRQLVRVDAALMVGQTLMSVVGPFLVGIATFLSTAALLGIDSASFVVSALVIALVARRAAPAPVLAPRPGERFLTQARAGLAFVFRSPTLRPQFSLYPLMESLHYALTFLMPAIAVELLGLSHSAFPFLLAAWSAGKVSGFLLARFSRVLTRRGLVLAANFVLQAIAFGMFLLGRSEPVELAALFAFGLPAGAAAVAMTTYLQQEIPDEMRGRCFAVLGTLPRLVMPMGPVVLTALAGAIGLRQSLVIVDLCFLACGLFLLSRRAVLAVR